MEEISLSIIIPTLNTIGDFTLDSQIRFSFSHCIASLLETTPDNVQIVVASNNGNPFDLPTGLPDRVKRINLWEQGQCKAVNAAVAMVNTEWIMVTNDDMIYSPRWLDKIFAPVIEEIQCISPKLIEPKPGSPTFEVHPFGGAGGDFDKKKWLEFSENYNPMYKEYTKIMPMGLLRNGFNLPLMIRKRLWDKIGGYDLNYDPWGSNGDSDIEYKIKLSGVQSYQNTNCVVYHFSQTSGTFHPDRRNFWQKNFDYFTRKWGFERVGGDAIWEASFDIPFDKLKYKPEWAKMPSVPIARMTL